MPPFLSRLVPRGKEPPPPRGHLHPRALHDQRTFGQKAADRVSMLCGSWRFILSYITCTFVWCIGNILLWTFDRYPYQFYTFSVSVLAILMTSLVLLAGNRQSEVDRAHAENAYAHVDEVNAKQDTQLHILEHQNDDAARAHREILTVLRHLNGRFDQLERTDDRG